MRSTFRSEDRARARAAVVVTLLLGLVWAGIASATEDRVTRTDEQTDGQTDGQTDTPDDRTRDANDETDDTDDANDTVDRRRTTDRVRRDGDDRITGLTTDLRLRSAEIESLDLDDSADEYVLFTFHERVVEIADESGFTVIGGAGDVEESAVDARLVRDKDNQVLVAFRSGTDLRDYPLAAVAADSVKNSSREGNPPASATLRGAHADAGTRPGPELDEVRLDTTLDRAHYRFDTNIDDRSPAARDFGFRTQSGRTSEGAEIISVHDDEVIVAFDDTVEHGKRFFARGGAVTDRQGRDSLPGAVGGNTTSPELDNARRANGRSQIEFRFTEDVEVADIAGFQVISDSGERYEGDSWTRVNARTIRVAFPDIRNLGEDEIVFAAVDADTVKDSSGSEAGNTLGGVRLRSSGTRSGRTAAPDLERIDADADTGQVTFVFDKELDDDVDPDPRDFLVLTEEGDLVRGRAFIEVDDDQVVITFDRGVVRAADGFLVEAGAVVDRGGTPSPAESLLGSSSSNTSRRAAATTSRSDRARDRSRDRDRDQRIGTHTTISRTLTAVGSPERRASSTSSSPSGTADRSDERTHVVVQGDTLWALAQRYGTTVATIVAANEDVIEDPDLIYPGERLVIP
jgi:hypothetical protein